MHALNVAVVAIAVVLAGCAGTDQATDAPDSVTPQVSPSAVGTIVPTETPAEATPQPPASEAAIQNGAEAAALVLEADPLFAGVGPLGFQIVPRGGTYYTVAERAGGWEVTVNLGWGDCPAGCIAGRTWTYAVSADGDVEMLNETGDSLDDPEFAPPYQPPEPADSVSIVAHLVAGDCSAEQALEDPRCIEGPMPRVQVALNDVHEGELQVAETTLGGEVEFAGLEPGVYIVEPGDHDAFPGPPPVAISAVGDHRLELFAPSDGPYLERPVMVSVTDDLVMRSIPRVADTSVIYGTLLQPGDRLWVLDGPRQGSGYVWFYGEALDPAQPRGIQTGWVAAADKDDTPWLATPVPEGDGWRLLGEGTSGEPYTLAVATDARSLNRLWADAGAGANPPQVDFDTELVVRFTHAVSGTCPEIVLNGLLIQPDERTVASVAIDPYVPVYGLLDENEGCTTDANPHAFVVAIERDALPSGDVTFRLEPAGREQVIVELR